MYIPQVAGGNQQEVPAFHVLRVCNQNFLEQVELFLVAGQGPIVFVAVFVVGAQCFIGNAQFDGVVVVLQVLFVQGGTHLDGLGKEWQSFFAVVHIDVGLSGQVTESGYGVKELGAGRNLRYIGLSLFNQSPLLVSVGRAAI